MDDKLKRLLDAARAAPPMTPEEIEAQKQSWLRGMTKGCEHGVLDYEQCEECRKGTD